MPFHSGADNLQELLQKVMLWLSHRKVWEQPLSCDTIDKSWCEQGRSTDLTGLILVLIISSVLLAMTGSLMPTEAALLVIGSGIALFTINFRRHQDHHRMILRSHELGASSASQVRHLGGLPFPVPTPVNLFLTKDFIRLSQITISGNAPAASSTKS